MWDAITGSIWRNVERRTQDRWLSLLCVYLSRQLDVFLAQFGVELLCTFGANAVRKFGIGVFLDIGINLAPIVIIIAYLLASCADRKEPTEHLREHFFQLFLERLPP